MSYLTSIPAYLLRNSLHRWLENPASPATKFLVPFLFGLLGLTVFGLLRGIESELREQLSNGDLRTLHTSEAIFGSEAETHYYEAMEEGSPWEPYCSRADLLFQVPLVAHTKFSPKTPILAYTSPPSFIQLPNSPIGGIRPSILLTPKAITGEFESLRLRETSIRAHLLPTPEKLKSIYRNSAVALVPAEMLEVALIRGHTRIQLLEPKPDISTKNLEELIARFSKAERRNIQIHSSSSVLQRLNEFISQQRLIRILLGGCIAIILSLVLGSLSLLEFRQELYLFALLRSLGVTSTHLFVHYLAETAFITISGGLTALWCCQTFLADVLNRSSTQLTESGEALTITLESTNSGDFFTIAGAILCGVVLSAIPFIVGLRKKPGLVLP